MKGPERGDASVRIFTFVQNAEKRAAAGAFHPLAQNALRHATLPDVWMFERLDQFVGGAYCKVHTGWLLRNCFALLFATIDSSSEANVLAAHTSGIGIR